MATQRQKQTASLGKFVQAGLIGGVIGAVITLVLYFIGNAVNGSPMSVDAPGAAPIQNLPIYAVVSLSVIPGLVAGLLYGILRRFTGSAKNIFLVIAVIVFALFIFGPIGAAQSNVTMWILQLMHVGAAVPIVTMLLRTDR
jgi:hypothetical protein